MRDFVREQPVQTNEVRQSFVWADQPDRLERIRRAIGVARSDPPELLRGYYLELLPELLAAREPGALTVVFSSNSTEYLTDEEFERLRGTIEDAGRAEPPAWVAFER